MNAREQLGISLLLSSLLHLGLARAPIGAVGRRSAQALPIPHGEVRFLERAQEGTSAPTTARQAARRASGAFSGATRRARPTRPVRSENLATTSAAHAVSTTSAGARSDDGASAARAGSSDPASELPVPLATNLAPVYPRAARRAGLEGVVVARILVRADGRVADIQIVAGPDIFHDAVRRALASWRYLPATRHGAPVTAARTIELPFSLR